MASGINPAATTSATAPASGSATNRATIAQNFESFLLLLTTQLKNQSPLDPLDTNQFTQQLVQFASVEQQLKSNDTLKALLTSSKTATASTAASFVGMTVSADGKTAGLSGGKAEWKVNAPRALVEAQFLIKDKDGNLVASKTQALAAGEQTYKWDGRTLSGTPAPDGDYTLTVTGRDASGQTASAKTEVTGRVDSVDLTGDEPVLVIGGARIPMVNVKSIQRATASP